MIYEQSKKKKCQHARFSTLDKFIVFDKNERTKLYTARCDECGLQVQIKKYDFKCKVVI